MSPGLIRPATAADAAGLAALWNPLIRDTLVTFAHDEKTEAEVAALIADRQAAGFAMLVAEQGGLLGFATYAQFRAGAGYATCMEHTVIVAPAAHGHGTGAALLAAVLDHARAGGAHQMIAAVSAENAAGLAFHARQGFAQIARIPQAGQKFGRFIDLVLMQKFL